MFSMGGEGSHAGSIMLELVDKSARERSARQIENALRPILAENLPQADIVFTSGMGFTGGGMDSNSAVVNISGYDIPVLFDLSQSVEDALLDIPGADDIESSLGGEGRPQITITYDRERMYDLGISTSQVSQLIQTAILGTVASEYKEGGREYDILVRLKETDRLSVEDIERLKIGTPRGAYVTLADIADLGYERAPVTINREDQQRVATVSFRAVGRPLGSVVAEAEASLRQLDWPQDYDWNIGGAAEDLQESLQWLLYALIIGMGLVYMVMAAQFESFRNPFIIFLTIPLSAIGVIWLLFATGTTINIFSMVGVIVLVGIVINNSIVLIDYINLLRLRNKGLLEATKEAARVRFRPVLMTALTTILAMFPLALQIGAGAETWGPMARSVIGGLLAGTFSTLIVIPVLYTIFAERSEKRKAYRNSKDT
jgi:HAE1 family hydrophobic/amphiphilic exporter-1